MQMLFGLIMAAMVICESESGPPPVLRSELTATSYDSLARIPTMVDLKGI